MCRNRPGEDRATKVLYPPRQTARCCILSVVNRGVEEVCISWSVEAQSWLQGGDAALSLARCRNNRNLETAHKLTPQHGLAGNRSPNKISYGKGSRSAGNTNLARVRLVCIYHGILHIQTGPEVICTGYC